MDENVEVAAGASAWLVQQARASGGEPLDGRREVIHEQGNVMQALAALFEESADGGIGGGRLE